MATATHGAKARRGGAAPVTRRSAAHPAAPVASQPAVAEPHQPTSLDDLPVAYTVSGGHKWTINADGDPVDLGPLTTADFVQRVHDVEAGRVPVPTQALPERFLPKADALFASLNDGNHEGYPPEPADFIGHPMPAPTGHPVHDPTGYRSAAQDDEGVAAAVARHVEAKVLPLLLALQDSLSDVTSLLGRIVALEAAAGYEVTTRRTPGRKASVAIRQIDPPTFEQVRELIDGGGRSAVMRAFEEAFEASRASQSQPMPLADEPVASGIA